VGVQDKDNPSWYHMLSGGVEQSPSGGEALLNIYGTFNTSGDLKPEVRSLAGILKVNISGSVGSNGGGLSGSVSIHKTTAECSPSVDAGTVISTAAWKHWEETIAWAYGGLISTGADTDDLEMTKTSTISVVDGYGMDDYWSLSGSFKEGQDTTQYKQDIILKAYFLNDGSISTLGANLKKDVITGFHEVFDYSHTDFIFVSYSYKQTGTTRRISSPSSPAEFAHWERSQEFSTVNEYTIEILVDGSVKEAKTYQHHYDLTDSATHTGSQYLVHQLGSQEWVDDSFTPNVSPYWNINLGGTNMVAVYEPVHLYRHWNGPATNRTEVDSYSDTDWGVVVNPLSPVGVTNQGFSDMEVKITGNRWVSLENLRTGARTAAYSGYGQTPDNHKDNIGYDPYDDLIIDYD